MMNTKLNYRSMIFALPLFLMQPLISSAEEPNRLLADHATLVEDVRLLKEQVKQLRADIPMGSILIVADEKGCPVGWSDMGPDWRGKTLVAAVRDSTDRYGFEKTGGAETHTLNQSEMPAHAHGMKRLPISASDGNRNNAVNVKSGAGEMIIGATTTEGGTQPHNNMPPYIALFFCKKEG